MQLTVVDILAKEKRKKLSKGGLQRRKTDFEKPNFTKVGLEKPAVTKQGIVE